jgi:hypothetical protein
MQPVSVKSVLKRALKQINLYDVYRRQRAITMWDRVCGKDVARVSGAEKLRGTVLFISTVDHIWASELSTFKYHYMERYNKLLGEGVVRDIRFKADPGFFDTKKKRKNKEYNSESVELTKKEEKKISELIEDISDEKCRELMEKFLRGKAKYERWLKKHGGDNCFGCGVMLNKGLTFCPHCIRELEQSNAHKLRELLENTPWITYGEAAKAITPISVELYDEIKEKLMESTYRYIIESMETVSRESRSSKKSAEIESRTAGIKGKIITWGMLKSGNKPAQLTNENLKKILPEVMFLFYTGSKMQG